MANLDIVIPVYNEGGNIIAVMESFHAHVKTSFRVLICYDMEDDNTLVALADYPAEKAEIVYVRNHGRGPNDAIVTGLKASTASAVLVHMADDDYNAGVIDDMYRRIAGGADIVTGSRYMPGGCYNGAFWLKEVLSRTASYSLYFLGGAPVRDSTNGFRMFSRRVLEGIEVESQQGFTFTIELLVKADRLGWTIEEVPALWFERTVGKSRFRIFKWVLPYFRWYLYGLATRWLRRGPASVRLRKPA
jgi:dolichol-phosphate mannosyltransferase